MSMVDYILNIDWMTTKEFCLNTGAKIPNVSGGVNAFLQIDAIKHRMFIEYAKFLNLNITLDMFIGDKAIFKGFAHCSQKEATENGIILSIYEFGENEFSITHKCISEHTGKMSYCTSFHLKKVEDILKCSGDFFYER